jgi:hypothetical protein
LSIARVLALVLGVNGLAEVVVLGGKIRNLLAESQKLAQFLLLGGYLVGRLEALDEDLLPLLYLTMISRSIQPFGYLDGYFPRLSLENNHRVISIISSA